MDLVRFYSLLLFYIVVFELTLTYHHHFFVVSSPLILFFLQLFSLFSLGRSNGRVYLYKYDNNTDTWGDFGYLSSPRNNSAFGYSVDLHGTNIVVGANGFVANQFENRKEFDARNTRK